MHTTLGSSSLKAVRCIFHICDIPSAKGKEKHTNIIDEYIRQGLYMYFRILLKEGAIYMYLYIYIYQIVGKFGEH